MNDVDRSRRFRAPLAIAAAGIVALLVLISGFFLVKGLSYNPTSPEAVATDGGTELDTDSITIVGDSVTVASRTALTMAFPEAAISAEVGTQLHDAPDVLEEIESSKGLGTTVVLALGTNGSGKASDLDDVLQIIGQDRLLVLVTPHGDRDWIAGVGELYQEYSEQHSDQVVVADWDAASPQVKDFADDGIHPGPQGGQILAQTISDAIDTAGR